MTGKFKLLCCKCGSDNVLEKSGRDKIDCEGGRAVHGEGIQRRCQDCDNEEFHIYRTWTE